MSDVSAVIVGSAVLISGTTVVRKVTEKKGADVKYGVVQPIIFGFLLASALLAIAIVSPEFAKGLAYLGMVGAFVVNGPALFTLIGKLGK